MLEFAEVWHEINNSLTAVNLTLEFLQQNTPLLSTLELKEELDFSLQSLEHVRNVIRLADGVGEYVTSEAIFFSLKELIESVAKVLSRKWPNFELQLINKTTNLEVYGSKTAMTQVFMNILSNAIESYGNGALERKLKVKITLKKGENGGAEVCIQDWGRGVPKIARSHLFEEGFTLKKRHGGKGIGLALCKKIIDNQFDGQINFKTRVGQGSEFKIVLPITS